MFSKVFSVIVVVAILGASAYEHSSSYVSTQSHPDLHGGYVGAISTDGQSGHEYYRQQENYHHYPAYDYNYKYGVEDYHSGDKKSQNEERHGGVVKGQYSLVQPDGVIRTVKYTADKHNGFRATVYYDGHPVNHGSPQHNDYY